jgi:hypothetical protein
MKKLTLFFFMLFSVITNAQPTDDGPPPPPPPASINDYLLPMIMIGVVIATLFYLKFKKTVAQK